MTPTLQRLVEQFSKLPSIGRKTAVRLAFSVLDKPREDVEAFAQALLDAKDHVRTCEICGSFCEDRICDVCADPQRDASQICVVQDYRSVLAFERVREYRGVYHVLHGALSPLNGVGPEKLKIAELLSRVAQGNVREVILATNPTIEGEATAMYLSRILQNYPVQVTRLAYGMPVGADLEYADEVTLLRAMEGRRGVDENQSL